jgi:hypothetical protein
MSTASAIPGVDLPLLDGAACAPNISAGGRRTRRRLGQTGVAICIALTGAALALRWPWYARGVVIFPAALAAVSLLQARRHTCIRRAAEGTIEHDDFSTSPAPAADAAASRRLSRGIVRDTLLWAVAGGAVAMATALAR